MYCPSTKLSAGNSYGDAKALERSRDDLSGPTTALGQCAYRTVVHGHGTPVGLVTLWTSVVSVPGKL
jgi:hypothetical protein